MSLLLLLIPLIGISIITIESNYGLSFINNIRIKSIALITSIFNLILSLIMFLVIILLLQKIIHFEIVLNFN